MELEKSEDDVFLATTHDVEEMFLGDPFDVHVQGTGIADGTCFVHGLIDILNNDKGCKFLSGELVFPDELPIYAGDVCIRVYQCREVDDF